MIHIRFSYHGVVFCDFIDEAGMARAYVDWAQLCGYGIEMEAV